MYTFAPDAQPLTLSSEHQSARMSKITNDGLTRSGTECFIAVPYGISGCQRVKARPNAMLITDVNRK